jgi:hypothetical protein
MGIKWKASGIEIERPRMVITLGSPWAEELNNEESEEGN